MAAFDTTRPVAVLSAGRIANFVANTFGTVAAWNDARTTRNSLSKLTSRELEDIGLTYACIDMIATRKTR
ncbi:MAG: DUF1127 domain-containing protein [Yoonia sp.]|jgi:uncharacterized protein YjiS (DUF1127 family)|nr:DUF1127 domain-containing protein [Yoonia sp.]MDG1519574.1 DUF1127 domain-containing protein [Yoonia sp.]MDG1768379.1 DUF1127 domain-containing protein [Yoonia sp.]MDG1867813.1 DUF1127 domain-containing protein [Yoonia sp.]